MANSIFQEYFEWLFNENIKSPIPKEILKSNSPISQQYAISVFLNNPKLNSYLNQYFNNINLWYLEKDELFIFLKKCVRDFKINRRSIAYIPWNKTSKLFEKLKNKIPNFKIYEISYLCDLIESSDKKDEIYLGLGLDKLEKPIKQTKKEKNKERKSVESFLSENFKFVEIG